MSEPWFDPSLYAWIPGTLFGTLGGLLGGLTGTLAAKGRAKGVVLGLWWLFIGVAAVFLCVGLVAFLSGQPYGIWYGLGLPGLIGMILFPALLPVVMSRYRAAEERRMKAIDLS